MSTYATQMWLLMMIGFVLGAMISLLAARVLLPKLKDLKHDSARASGEQT